MKYVADNLRLLGNKGATGTQASFLRLLGDAEKVLELERRIAERLGFASVFPVSGQTYTRKRSDMRIQNVLAGIAQRALINSQTICACSRASARWRSRSGKNQVGSSAMAYKRNPMRCERVCSLARFVMANAANAPMTASTQWLERTLDDSANRRLSLAEGFLAVDAILNVLIDVTGGIVVYPKISEKRLRSQLPYIATENILMEAVKKGGDRQKLHEKIRTYSVESEVRYKQTGAEPTLIEDDLRRSRFRPVQSGNREHPRPEGLHRPSTQADRAVSGALRPPDSGRKRRRGRSRRTQRITRYVFKKWRDCE